MKQKCNKCEQVLPYNKFYKCARRKQGITLSCKICTNEYQKNIRLKNPKKFKETRRKNYYKNIEKHRERNREYSKNHKKDKQQYDIVYRQQNKDKIRQHKRNWFLKNKDNPEFKIKRNIRRRIHHMIVDGYKSLHSIELLGCDIEFYKSYLESMFKLGMTWDNYGPKWHIDHIKPCNSFDLTDVEQQKECFNYKNTQPLWKIENLRKGRKVIT
jgi:hypothetical protein